MCQCIIMCVYVCMLVCAHTCAFVSVVSVRAGECVFMRACVCFCLHVLLYFSGGREMHMRGSSDESSQPDKHSHNGCCDHWCCASSASSGSCNAHYKIQGQSVDPSFCIIIFIFCVNDMEVTMATMYH